MYALPKEIMPKPITDLKAEIECLKMSVRNDEDVRAALKKAREKVAPKIIELNEEIKELKSKKPQPKPRWPDDVPPHILEIVKAYWRGTEESYTYRIHCWNNKACWTSYPSGGYSNNGGWNPTPATFYMISLTEKSTYDSKKAKDLLDAKGRTSLKFMKAELDKLT